MFSLRPCRPTLPEQIDGIEAKYPAPAPIITATNPDERDPGGRSSEQDAGA